MMEIILLRHGKPVIPSLSRMSATEFIQWVKSYNLSGLCSSSKPTEDAISMAEKCDAVVCSELLRSIESTNALNIRNVTLKSAKFNEADLPIAHWNYLKISPKLWIIIFRIFWLFGYSTNSESFKEAKLRAAKSASMLIGLAETHGRVLFVGHGVYNRLLANELKSAGWLGPKNPSRKYWGFSIYACK